MNVPTKKQKSKLKISRVRINQKFGKTSNYKLQISKVKTGIDFKGCRII